MSSSPPAYDPGRHGPIPERFLQGCQGRPEEAGKRWAATWEWRRANNIDGMLSEPQPHFRTIKRLYPHCLHGRAKNGNFVYFEAPGQADVASLLAPETGITIDAMLRHYIFTTEWLWTVLDTRPSEGKLISVWDLTGVSMRNLAGDVQRLMRNTMGIMRDHYPERSDKLFVINAPYWFAALWRMVAPLLDPNTKAKISICGTNYQRVLADYIGAENLPVRFGGLDPRELGDSEQEAAMLEHVQRVNGELASQAADSLPPLPPSPIHRLSGERPTSPGRDAAHSCVSHPRRNASASAKDFDAAVSGGRVAAAVADSDVGPSVGRCPNATLHPTTPGPGLGLELELEAGWALLAPLVATGLSSGVSPVPRPSALAKDPAQLMLQVEVESRRVEGIQPHVQAAQAEYEMVRRTLEALVGRKVGLGQQMLCVIANWRMEELGDDTFHSLGASTHGTPACPSSARADQHSSLSVDAPLSLTMTMQLRRIQREAEALEGQIQQKTSELHASKSHVTQLQRQLHAAIDAKRVACNDLADSVNARRPIHHHHHAMPPPLPPPPSVQRRE